MPGRGRNVFKIFSRLALACAVILGGCRFPTVATSSREKSLSAKSFPLPPPRTVTLLWSYGDLSNIVFNIWTKTNLAAAQWQFVATTPDKQITLPAGLPCAFFTVTASNVLTGIESVK